MNNQTQNIPRIILCLVIRGITKHKIILNNQTQNLVIRGNQTQNILNLVIQNKPRLFCVYHE